MKSKPPGRAIEPEVHVQAPHQGARPDNESAALRDLAALLDAEDKGAQRRAVERLVAVAEAQNGRCVEEMLGRLLDTATPRARWAAAYALARLDACGAIAAKVLLDALSSPDRDLRWASARVIARIGDKTPGLVTPELLALARGEQPVARRMALYTLRYLGAANDEILSLVEEAARAPSTLVRLAALSLLTSVGSSSTRAAAIALRLVDSDPEVRVRRAAAVALGRIGTRSADARAALSRIAADKSDGILARVAGRSLRRLGY